MVEGNMKCVMVLETRRNLCEKQLSFLFFRRTFGITLKGKLFCYHTETHRNFGNKFVPSIINLKSYYGTHLHWTTETENFCN